MSQEPTPPTATPPAGDRFRNLVGWPPPGLARVQGDLWLVVRKMSAAGAVLVTPLLFAVTIPQSSSGLGPLGESWWILVVTTLLGLGLFADAFVALLRILSRTRRARSEGYSGHVVGLVLSDRDKDNGFLLQGAQMFSTLSSDERKALGTLRLLSPVLYLTAATWFVVGFGVLVLFAARGQLSAGGIAFGTFVPMSLLGLAGIAFRAAEGTLVRRAKRVWYQQPWAQELTRQDVTDWQKEGLARGWPLPEAEHFRLVRFAS